MHTISAKTNGCVLIDGQPFQVGDLRIKFSGNQVSVFDKMTPTSSILIASFDQVTNPTTGIAFVSIDSLKAFIQSNFFDNAADDTLLAANSYTDDKIEALESQVLNATLTTNPADTPSITTFNAIGGAGTYVNFLTAAVTPAIFTDAEINPTQPTAKRWQLVLPQGATYWVKQALPGTLSLATSFDVSNNTQPVSATSINSFLAEIANSISFSDATKYAIALSSISNPTTRYSKAVDANGYLQINQVYAGVLLIGLLLPDNNALNKVYDTTASFDAVASNTGFGLCINPSSGTVMDATNHLTFMWRSNGTLSCYKQDGTTVNALPVFSPAVNVTPIPSFVAGDVCRMVLKYSDDVTSATLSLFVNDIKGAEFSVTNIPAGYIGAMHRNIGGGTAPTASISRIRSFSSVYVQEKTRSLYINGLSPAGGNGTDKYPFTDIKSALLKTTEVAGDLGLYFKDGIYRGSLQFQAYKYRNINVFGHAAGNTEIISSTLVASGWTKTAGYTNIYERPHMFAGSLNSGNAGGGFIDLSNTFIHVCGDVLPFTIYTRLTPNGSMATLDTTPGASLVNTVTKVMYIHAVANVDPNTLQLEYANNQFSFGALLGQTTDSYFCQVRLKDLTFKYAYSHNVAIQRAYIEAENVKCIGSAISNGFGLDDSVGRLYGCEARANYNDGYNAKGGAGLGAYHKMFFYDCLSVNQIVGDGYSNHDGIWHFDGVIADGNGKDGIIPTDRAIVKDSIMSRNTAGFQLYPNPLNGADASANLWNCVLKNNRESGIHCEPGTVGSFTSTINAYNCRLEGNPKALMAYNTSGTPSRTVINAYNPLDGGGNAVNVSNTGGIINIHNDIPLS